jgi:hypothetical protein
VKAAFQGVGLPFYELFLVFSCNIYSLGRIRRQVAGIAAI